MGTSLISGHHLGLSGLTLHWRCSLTVRAILNFLWHRTSAPLKRGGTPSSAQGLSNDSALLYLFCHHGASNPQKSLSTLNNSRLRWLQPSCFQYGSSIGRSTSSILYLAVSGKAFPQKRLSILHALRLQWAQASFCHSTALIWPIFINFIVHCVLGASVLHFIKLPLSCHFRASWLSVIWFWKRRVVTKNNKDTICNIFSGTKYFFSCQAIFLRSHSPIW